MTSFVKLTTMAALGALLATPLAIAQQNGSSGTAQNQSANASSSMKTNLMPGSSDHDVGMANANGSAYHNTDPNTNNGWNAQNTGDTPPTNAQGTPVNTGGQGNSNNR